VLQEQAAASNNSTQLLWLLLCNHLWQRPQLPAPDQALQQLLIIHHQASLHGSNSSSGHGIIAAAVAAAALATVSGMAPQWPAHHDL
jgi:ABC-type nitrate/sulfonate/bicarbonate transport system permease component